MKNKQGKNMSRIGGEKGEVERNQTRNGQDYWKPKSSEAGARNKPEAGGNGEPQQDSEQSKTRLTPSSQGHRRRGRTGEWRASRAEESAHAKALKHARVWHVPRALRKLVWFRE